MFELKFSDGTPVPQDYQDRLYRLLADVARAEELFTPDELEQYAAQREEQEKEKKEKQA